MIKIFNSTAELLDYSAEQHFVKLGSNRTFYGRSNDGIRALVESGAPTQTQTVNALKEKVRLFADDQDLTTGQEIAYDVTGDDLDIGRYMAGEPDCWSFHEPAPTKPELTVIVNMCYYHGVTDREIQNFGAAVFSAIEELSLDYTVRPIVVYGGNYKSSKDVLALRLPHDPLDLDGFSTMVCDKAFFRRIIFNAWSRLYNNKYAPSQTTVREPNENELSYISEGGKYIYIPGLDRGDYKTLVKAANSIADLTA
jgi:hypothetical protein